MKEVKFLLLCFTVAAYTSLGWLTFLIDWLGDVGRALFIMASCIFIVFCVFYLLDHWKDERLFKD